MSLGIVKLGVICGITWVTLAPGAGMKAPETKIKSPPVVMQSTALPAKYELIYQNLKKERADYPCEKAIRKVERLGDNTLAVESYLCLEGDLTLFRKIAADWANYDKWVLTRINEKLGGGNYLIQFLDVESGGPDDVILKYLVDFPFMKKERQKHFKMSTTHFARAFVLAGEGIEDSESLLEYARAELVAFHSPKKTNELWIFAQGKTKLKSDILYSALPEKVLRTEAGDRIQRVMENYEAREVALGQVSTLNPTPK